MGSGRVALRRSGVWVVVACALACAYVSPGAVGQERRVGPAPEPIPERKAPAEDADFPPLKVIEFDVVDPATNKPVKGVKLRGRVNNQQRTWMTGEDGHVKLDVDGNAKSLSIAATRDGYVPTTVQWAAPPRGEGIPGEYLMKLERGTTIGGRVLDEGGQPIAGVDVALALERAGERSVGPTMILGERVSLYNVHVKTDPDGRWHFDEAPARLDPARVQLVHPDFLSDELMGQRTAPAVEKLRDGSSVMVMVKGVAVSGRVTDPDGKPVVGAQLSLGATRFGIKSPQTRSGPDGRYVLANCRPGQQATLVVIAKGLAPSMTQFSLEQAGATRDVALAAARPRQIRVVDAAGRPVQGATVSWRMMDVLTWRATTDGDGRVTWDEAPTDAVEIGAYAPGFIESRDRAVAPAAEHVITLAKVLHVTGTVVDDETGKPVKGFRAVRGWTSQGRPAPFWSRDEGGVEYGPAGSGTFNFGESTQRDGYAVRVEAAGYLPIESRELKPGEEDVKLEFRLKHGKDLVATLRSADGKPLGGADVIVINESTQVMVTNGKPTSQTFALKTKADAAGTFRFDPQAGKFSVLVLHDLGFASLSPEDLAKEGAVIVVPPWATVRGTAWVGAKPAAGRTVVAMQAGRGPTMPRLDCNAVVNERGEFVLERVPPGEAIVGIEVRTQVNQTMWNVTWTQQKRVEAAAGKVAEVKLGGTGRTLVGQLSAPAEIGDRVDWRAAEVRLTARVAAKRQLPADYAQLTPEARQTVDQAWARSPEGQAAAREASQMRRSYPAAVDAKDGSVRVEDVEPGTYVLTARVFRSGATRDTWAAASVEVTVPEIADGRNADPVNIGDVNLKVAPPRAQP